MLSLRYREKGENSKEKILDYDDCHEILDDEDIMSFLGNKGAIMELRHKINFFCSEEELVEYMSIPLDEEQGEIYYIPDVDEGTKLCIVFRAIDMSKFYGITEKLAAESLFDACVFIREAIASYDIAMDCSINYIQAIVESSIAHRLIEEDKNDLYGSVMCITEFGMKLRVNYDFFITISRKELIEDLIEEIK